jgi:transcription elongation factor GreA
MKKQFHLTKEGIEELKAELSDLLEQRMPIAERIKNAREFGDLAENAEYTSALSEKERNETRITEIEHILQNGEVIKKPRTDNKVQLGSTVTLKEGSKTKEFTVVGTVEADPLNGKISDESPIGKALLGKKEGEKVEIQNGGGDLSSFKIVNIT